MVGPGAKSVNEVTSPERIYIRVASTKDQALLTTLKATLDEYRGSTEVVLVLGDETNRQAIKLPAGLDRESEGMFKLRELVGAENFKIH
ncbi:hypothetical protein H7Y63_02060 [Polaromonas sp.]|nr:hypothetical protein [Candidatus Saccharibacteria bacterium]